MTAPPPAAAATMTLGARIRERRRANRMSAAELAGAVGMHRNSILSYETDRSSPTAGTLARLAESLECTIDELIDGFAPPIVDDAATETSFDDIHPALDVELCKTAFYVVGMLQGAMAAIREIIISDSPFDAVSALDHFRHKSDGLLLEALSKRKESSP
jgi:transcriptional regulator with XRE-family HTH domain